MTGPAPAIPDYELLRRVGHGAYGEVWLARNLTGSFVAVKVVARAAFEYDRPFEREFEGIKRFEPISRSDPAQVAILHVGRGDGFFYYVMELADDVNVDCGARNAELGATGHSVPRTPESYAPHTLREDLKRHGRLPVAQCVQIGLALTGALAHLHKCGLVHRDVKPSNVIFVGGVPKLADIGLVASVDATRSMVGTEGYVAPEGPGTPQADIFSLGKLLYEISTGSDRKEFPALPSDIATRPDRDALIELNAVVMRACQFDPRQRYANAEAMQADLALLQRGKSVKRQHKWLRILKPAKRIALSAGALAIVSALVYWQAIGRSRPPEFQLSANEEANREYRQGMALLHSGQADDKTIAHLKKAIAIDPHFAEAWARLASEYFSGAGRGDPSKGPVEAREAVRLNPKSAFAHIMLATAKLGELDWRGADEERREAVKLQARGRNPDSEEVLLVSAMQLAVMGKTNAALADLQRAHRTNPDATSKLRMIYSGFVYAWSRDYPHAIEIYDQYPDNADYWLYDQHAQACLGMGDYTNAMRYGKLAALGSGEEPEQVKQEFDALERGFKEGGEQKYWELRLEFESRKTGEYQPMRMATIYARLNETDKAFEYLRRAMKETPDTFNVGIYTNPSFDRLRGDRRFQEITDELWRNKRTRSGS